LNFHLGCTEVASRILPLSTTSGRLSASRPVGPVAFQFKHQSTNCRYAKSRFHSDSYYNEPKSAVFTLGITTAGLRGAEIDLHDDNISKKLIYLIKSMISSGISPMHAAESEQDVHIRRSENVSWFVRAMSIRMAKIRNLA